jgi:putative ATP-dependent endonuclease of OLD family
MKLRRILIENVRSFLDPQELKIPGEIAILIGPNGGGKTNLLDTAVTALRLHLLKSWVARHNPQPEWQERYEWINNDQINSRILEKHTRGAGRQQRIELDVEVTPRDVEISRRQKPRPRSCGNRLSGAMLITPLTRFRTGSPKR